MASVAENLKKLRTVKWLTQEDVASQIGLTRQAISSYESGRTQPPLDLLTRFAEIYGVRSRMFSTVTAGTSEASGP